MQGYADETREAALAKKPPEAETKPEAKAKRGGMIFITPDEVELFWKWSAMIMTAGRDSERVVALRDKMRPFVTEKKRKEIDDISEQGQPRKV